MANSVRGEPFEFVSLRDAMDRLFDESFLRPFDGVTSQGGPAVDVAETDNEVLVKATVPGLKPGDLKITLTGDMLQIVGEVQSENEQKNATYHLRERRFGSFSRSVPLPAPVISDQAKAEFENGVLTMTLPKAEAVRPKVISVKAK